MDFRTYLIFFRPTIWKVCIWCSFQHGQQVIFSLFATIFGSSCWPNNRIAGLFFFFAGTSTLAFFWKLEAPSIFTHSGFNVTVEEGGAPLEDGGGHCSSRSAPTLLTDLNVPLSPASPAAAQLTHTKLAARVQSTASVWLPHDLQSFPPFFSRPPSFPPLIVFVHTRLFISEKTKGAATPASTRGIFSPT